MSHCLPYFENELNIATAYTGVCSGTFSSDLVPHGYVVAFCCEHVIRCYPLSKEVVKHAFSQREYVGPLNLGGVRPSFHGGSGVVIFLQ